MPSALEATGTSVSSQQGVYIGLLEEGRWLRACLCAAPPHQEKPLLQTLRGFISRPLRGCYRCQAEAGQDRRRIACGAETALLCQPQGDSLPYCCLSGHQTLKNASSHLGFEELFPARTFSVGRGQPRLLLQGRATFPLNDPFLAA